MRNKNFVCPYCNYSMVLSDGNYEHKEIVFQITKESNPPKMDIDFYVCSNPQCGKHTFYAEVSEGYSSMNISGPPLKKRRTIYSRRLIPTARAIVVPDCVPAQIAQDYTEACEIVDISPKAAGALIRRCLQGMVRDFWKVSGRSLEKEIDAIKDKIDPDTWDAINGLRQIGNISAHMEKDVNIIVDVEPQEVELLISLVESLFDEWYVNREKRQKRNTALVETAKRKEEQRHPDKSATNSGK